MDQGTKDWLNWRSQGIGASDSAIILGQSKYKTAFELWLEKTGQREAEPIAMHSKAKGGEVEAQLRARYSLDTGKNFIPVLWEHDTHKYLLASLDGYADGEIIEIKFVGKDYYEQEEIKKEHWIQMQHQMMATGLDRVTYLKSVDGVAYKSVTVLRDEIFIHDLEAACHAFYYKVQKMMPPDKTEDDEWEAEGEFLDLLKQGDRDKIKAAMPHARMRGAGKKLVRSKNGALRITEIDE